MILSAFSGCAASRRTAGNGRPVDALLSAAVVGRFKPADAAFLADIEHICNLSNLSHQSLGNEQRVYSDGKSEPRSLELLPRTVRVTIPECGRMLDVGCGDGALLKSFAQLRPKWALAGAELSDTHRATVENIPGVEALYVGKSNRFPANSTSSPCCTLPGAFH